MPTFSQQVAEFVVKTEIKGTLVMRKLALDAFTGVLLRSPVDTGRFRGNWRVAVGLVEDADLTTTLGPRDGAAGPGHTTPGPVTIGVPPQVTELQESNEIFTAPWGSAIVISNNLPYAKRLEDGYSAQTDHMPGGILLATFQEVKAKLIQRLSEAKAQGGGA